MFVFLFLRSISERFIGQKLLMEWVFKFGLKFMLTEL